jgi:hypothetical protein
MIRLALLALALVTLATPAFAQATIRVNTQAIFHWNPYTAAAIADAGIVRFDVQIDGNPIVSTEAGVPTPTPIPAVEYQYLVPQAQMVLGPHIGRVRACSVDECSQWDEGTVVVRPMLPPTPTGAGFKPVVVVLTPVDAAEIAHGYGKAASRNKRQRLSDGQLNFLGARYVERYPDQVLRDDRLFDLLEAEYVRLVH